MSNIKNMKGNLRNPRGLIMKIRTRDHDGRVIHKNEFTLSDNKSVEKELRVWKNNFGVSPNVFKDVLFNPVSKEDLEIIRDQVKERMKKDNEKLKEALKDSNIKIDSFK